MHRRQGHAILEFALVSTFLAPLLGGTFVVGMTLVRNLQAAEISRDAGRLYLRLREVPGDGDLGERLAQGLRLAHGGANGAVILSKVVYVSDADCAAAGYAVGDSRCVNRDRYVFQQQIVTGNPALGGSQFGTATGALYDTRQNITNWLTHPGLRASGFGRVLQLKPGEAAYVAEARLRAPELELPGQKAGKAIYARSIF
jgi:hypothetical protein